MGNVDRGYDVCRLCDKVEVDRRTLLGAAAAGLVASAPLRAMAEASQATTVDVPLEEPVGEVVTALNEVAYPEPIASDDYDRLWSVLEGDMLGDAFYEALDAFANELTCFGIGMQAPDEDRPNVCISPASLYLALALLAQGAGTGSSTAEQLLGVLRAADAESLAQNCAKLMRILWARTTPEGDEYTCSMKVANSVWMRSDIPFEQAFLNTAADSFYSECFGVAGLDSDQAEENLAVAGEKMGEWVADKTGGTLKPEFALDSMWVAGLINTVYFRDSWAEEFNANDTFEDKFHAPTGDVSCQFMTLTKECEIAHIGGATVAWLGLSSGSCITFALPDEGMDARALLGRATGIGKMFSTEGGDLADVTFVVPKLSFDTKTDLARVCEAMGVADVFGPDADLTGMTPVPANLSTVEQGTHFAMDEQGVEASAYTALMIECMALLPEALQKRELRLDRPFLFRLTSPEGVVLFDGLVGDPTRS